MHPADIKAALKKAGATAAAIARERGVSQPTVSEVILGNRRSAPTELRVAEITGLPLSHLWPQWYSPGPGAPEERGISLVGFRARLGAELDRLDLSPEAVAAVARVSVDDVSSWRSDGGAYPTVPSLIWLGQATRIDLAYVMTGRREVTHG
jgi:lambda repressor-like predicted transcriptional regulator